MSLDVENRRFEPGTSGWSTADLDDPAIERIWSANRYELIEGVLSSMPPALFDPNKALGRLTRKIEKYLDENNLSGEFADEIDFVLSPTRVVKCDTLFTTPADDQRQIAAVSARAATSTDEPSRLLIVPTLIIESVSLGHERHDRDVKRRWYAEAGVPNYWIFDANRRSIEALRWRDGQYDLDCSARDQEDFRPTLFPGLVIPLGTLWFR